MWTLALVAGAAEPFVLTTDRAVLSELEERGFMLGDRLAGVHTSRGAVLAGTPEFQGLLELVRQDQREAVGQDTLAGTSMRHSHRAFDPAWLVDPASRYDLVGVLHRADRQRPGQCGEARLVYRLATEVPFDTPLPFSLLLAYGTGDEDCAAEARRWLDPGKDLAGWLADRLAREELTALELDWQTVRWPSSTRPDLGGHAEYVLRVLYPQEGGSWMPVPLENTPDVQRLQQDPALHARAVRWAAAAAQDPLLLLPDELRATKATVVTPGGLSRLANRPWAQLETGLPEEVVRKLDAQTCQGCHAVRSTAGFHLPGQVGDPSLGLAVPVSPHLGSMLAFRGEELLRRAAGKGPSAPPPVEPTGGGEGTTCRTDEGGCHEGLECLDLYGDGWGTCELPLGQGPGAACELSTLTTSADALQDKAEPGQSATCIIDEAPAICRPTGGGFPGGLCRSRCTEVGAVRGDAVCATMQEGAFTECLGSGQSLALCLEQHQSPFWIDRCDSADPCREGYVCSAAVGAPAGVGACRPTYALPQLRVDTRMTGKKKG
jgi:hypothetical protein